MIGLVERIRKSSMRILLVRVSALGDAIHTLPALDLLKKQLPHANIDWLVQQKNFGIVSHIPGINQVYTLHDHYLRPAQLRKTFALLKILRNNRYDLVIDFQGLCKTSFLCAALDLPSIGFSWHTAREGLSSTVHLHTVVVPKTISIIEKNKALALAAVGVVRRIDRRSELCHPGSESGVTKDNFPPGVIPTPLDSAPQPSTTAQQNVTSWLNKHHARRLVILTPNTTWDSKHWPIERWEELALKLLPLPHHTVMCVGQKFGKQGASLATFIEQHNLPIVIAPAWSLDELFAVMHKTDVIVAPDTGLLHIADSIGVHTIGLYGPTLAQRHGPQITSRNKELCFQVSCSHEYQKTHGASDCMNQLSAQAVIERINTVVSEKNRLLFSHQQVQ